MQARLRMVLAVGLVLATVATLVAIDVLSGADPRPAPGSPFEGSLLPADVPAPAFDLRDQDGDRIRMSDFRGKPVVVTFLYTNCEDTCPTEAHQIRGALDQMDRDVPALAVAVDPPRDTPSSARRFLAEQNVEGYIDFVLGSRRELAKVWGGFFIQPQTERIEHQARVVLVDRSGFQRVGYPASQITPERLAHDLNLLLDEGRSE